MGTGLGCGLLVAPHKQNGHHTVLPLETGHTLITTLGCEDPAFKEEENLIQYLSKKIYQNKFTLEWEDICSGRGLVHCYDFATKSSPHSEKTLDAGKIIERAMSGEPEAVHASLLHYKYLIRAGQNQCVGFQAKGIFLAGDNQVANDPFVSKHMEELKAEFLNHPKQGWIADSFVFRQIKSLNLNLLGCMFVAQKLL